MAKTTQQPKPRSAAASSAASSAAAATATVPTEAAQSSRFSFDELKSAIHEAEASGKPGTLDLYKPTLIIVRAKDDRGFRRAGRYWPAVETTVPFAEFSNDQLTALVNEPELEVAFMVQGECAVKDTDSEGDQ